MWIFKHSQRLVHVPSLLQFIFFSQFWKFLLKKEKFLNHYSCCLNGYLDIIHTGKSGKQFRAQSLFLKMRNKKIWLRVTRDFQSWLISFNTTLKLQNALKRNSKQTRFLKSLISKNSILQTYTITKTTFCNKYEISFILEAVYVHLQSCCLFYVVFFFYD